MNPTTRPEPQLPACGRWVRLAWLPIPLLLAAIIAVRMAGLRDSYESHTLLLVLSFTFYTLVSLGTLYLIGRSFLATGSPGLLLLECGVLLWSLAGTVGDFVSYGDANINVTIFNTGILLAALCHLAGAVLARRPLPALRAKPLWLMTGCAFSLGGLWLVAQAALAGWLPVFFIQGQGGTVVRYCVLIAAIAMFVLSAGVLHANQRAARLPFITWYALALLLLAVGLFGVMIQLSLGSVVNWLSRAAQWCGGVYLLFAALASLSESQLPLLPPEKKSQPAYYRDAVAVSVVVAAAAIRLTFLSAMGTNSPYLVFYPAVMFAAIYGGGHAALLATFLAAFLANYFWVEPAGQLTIGLPADWLALLVFLLGGAMIAWITDAMHSARARASEAETQALLAAEHEAATEALQAGRTKLEAVLSSMTDAVFISDVRGRFLDFNEAFATFHKFRNKEECAKTFAESPDILDVFLPDGTLAPLELWAVPRALRGETATTAEYTLRRKDTGETWVGSYSFGPIRDKDGAIAGSVVVARDITVRRKAYEALRQSEERYRTLFNTMMEGFCIIEVIFDSAGRPVDFRFLEINPAFAVQTGLQNAQGRLMRELAPGHEAHWFEIYGKIALTGEPARFVNEARALDRWYDVSAYRVGKPEDRQVAMVFNDITDQKRSEEKLHKAYGELEEHVQQRTQKLKDLNEKLEQRVTERAAALQAANASLRDSRLAALNLMEDAVAARKQTEAVNAELLREVLERQRAEEEREIAAGFLQLINGSKDTEDLVRSAVGYFREYSGCEAVGIRLKDGDDYPYFEVHGFPREFVRMENSLCAHDEAGRPLYNGDGYPVMECMCGNVIQRRFDPSQPFFSDHGSFWTNSTTQLLATTTESSRQSRTRNRCNGEGYESVALVAIRAGEAPVGLLQLNDRRPGCFSPERIALWERLAGYMGIALEKFLAEGALRQRSLELQAVNRDLEAFIYSVSHDLRTPMRSMAVFTKLIADSCADRLEEREKDYFRRVRDAGVKMNRLVEDLLYLSRVSRQEINRTEFDLSDLASHIVSELREASPRRNVEVDIQKDLRVVADLQLIELVLANLLGNAWKFTLKTDKARIALGVMEQEELTTYYVRDNGAGFDPEYAGKMFHPFQRLHSDDEFEGTGIGLAIVEQAIRRHGGRVWAEGDVGKGATVYFTLA